MKEVKEKELKNFFLTVANYLLPENAEEYFEALKKIPITSSHYDYAEGLRRGLEYKLGRSKLGQGGHKFGQLNFHENELDLFQHQRNKLVLVLDQIISGQVFLKLNEIIELLNFANKLQPQKRFDLFQDDDTGDVGIDIIELYSKRTTGERKGDIIVIDIEGGRQEIEPVLLDNANLSAIFYLSCYSLNLFLADGRRDQIKKCIECGCYFAKPKADKFCTDKHRLAFNNRKDINSGKRAQQKRQRQGWERLSPEQYTKKYGKEQPAG